MCPDHRDSLTALNKQIPLRDKLKVIHQSLKKTFPFIDRIAIALYDAKTELLKTYVHSSGEDNPLERYQTPINNAPSLRNILREGHPRVINNLLTFEKSDREHTARIGRSGYAASYTLPMFNDGIFFGFTFYNSKQSDVFTDPVLHNLDMCGHMISLMVINELSSIRTLTAAIKTTGHLTHLRDPETGSHLDRMSRYSRLIALELAESHQLSDDYIEHIFMFSPLHDIGKIGIPDGILLKPDQLSPEEMSIMKTHSLKGREMVDDLVNNFGLQNFQHMDILRNIIEFHHEKIDGSGYPMGMSDEQIPLEARIVAVADIFDALTSRRPYKKAWSNEKAFDHLKQLSGTKLDAQCVEALIRNLPSIEEIQQQFAENLFG